MSGICFVGVCKLYAPAADAPNFDDPNGVECPNAERADDGAGVGAGGGGAGAPRLLRWP
jgi:hypothetical protein